MRLPFYLVKEFESIQFMVKVIQMQMIQCSEMQILKGPTAKTGFYLRVQILVQKEPP